MSPRGTAMSGDVGPGERKERGSLRCNLMCTCVLALVHTEVRGTLMLSMPSPPDSLGKGHKHCVELDLEIKSDQSCKILLNHLEQN